MFSRARFRIGLVAGACAVSAVVLAISARHSEPDVQPGTTVLSVAVDAIRSITYRAGVMTLTARRLPAGPFAVQVTYSDGRAPQMCQVSRDLAGLLPDLVEIDARRQLTPQQVRDYFPIDAGTMEIEDNVDEPMSPFRLRLSRDRSAVALIDSGVAVEVDLPPAVFDRLGKGCAALAGDEKVAKLWSRQWTALRADITAIEFDFVAGTLWHRLSARESCVET